MKKWLFIGGIVIVLGAAGVAATVWMSRPEKTEIKTDTISAQGNHGRIVQGKNQVADSARLQTNAQLTYESAKIESPKPQSNAAVLKWSQTDGSGSADLEFRVYDGKRWSAWTDANDPETERPDKATVQHDAMILANEIHQIQYRFTMKGKDGKASPLVDISDAKIELIDTHKGASPTKKKPLQQLLEKFGFIKSAKARADGPHIYSRADWGSPQPDGSPDWTPEYRKVDRAIVHHTATAMTSDPATMIRAIWYFHTYTRGWGDIGYNYLVDGYGNIYQGRYFDHSYSDTSRLDVVGGHAYGWNYGTTGIAALGDYTGTNGPTDATLRSIGDIIAFKLHRSGVEPSGYTGSWPSVVGHRDVVSTECPANIHNYLPNIRQYASAAYGPYYLVDHLDYQFVAQGKDGQQTNSFTMKAGDTADLFFDIKNTGVDTWSTSGQNPVRLGTDGPHDRGSAFDSGSWVGPGRPASFGYIVNSYNGDGTANLTAATQIAPGQIARFVFPVKAPETGGQYDEHFQPVAEGYSWFIRNYGMHFMINVAPRDFSWHGLSQTVYTDNTKTTTVSSNGLIQNRRAGQQYYVEVKIKNDGDQTWSNTGSNPTRLGTFNPRDRSSALCDASWINCGRPATMQESSVAPGGTATFGFLVNMPYNVNDQIYREYFNLVTEGRSWAPDQGMYWQFEVAGENLTAYPTAIRAYTDNTQGTPADLANVSPSQRFYVVVYMRNDGNVTWATSGQRPVKLGATNPMDRHSGVCDSTWLDPVGCARITTAQGGSVAPGAEGAYGFWVQAPPTVGRYIEWLNLVSESFSWFRNSPTPLVFTVR